MVIFTHIGTFLTFPPRSVQYAWNWMLDWERPVDKPATHRGFVEVIYRFKQVYLFIYLFM